jgi:hypothetical protein
VSWGTGLPDYFSDGLRVEDFSDLTVDSFSGSQAHAASGAAISLHNGTGVAITNSRAMPGTRLFLQLENVENRRAFVNYDLTDAAKIIEPSNLHFTTELGVPAGKRKTAFPR